MRLRCARASLRSSGVTSERERLRGGNSEAEVDDEAGEGHDSGEPGSCSTTKAESAVRFIVVAAEEGVYEVLRGEERKD